MTDQILKLIKSTQAAWEIKDVPHDTALAAYIILQFSLQKQLDFFSICCFLLVV